MLGRRFGQTHRNTSVCPNFFPDKVKKSPIFGQISVKNRFCPNKNDQNHENRLDKDLACARFDQISTENHRIYEKNLVKERITDRLSKSPLYCKKASSHYMEGMDK
jgi:hypothetical protein